MKTPALEALFKKFRRSTLLRQHCSTGQVFSFEQFSLTCASSSFCFSPVTFDKLEQKWKHKENCNGLVCNVKGLVYIRILIGFNRTWQLGFNSVFKYEHFHFSWILKISFSIKTPRGNNTVRHPKYQTCLE